MKGSETIFGQRMNMASLLCRTFWFSKDHKQMIINDISTNGSPLVFAVASKLEAVGSMPAPVI